MSEEKRNAAHSFEVWGAGLQPPNSKGLNPGPKVKAALFFREEWEPYIPKNASKVRVTPGKKSKTVKKPRELE